MLVEDTARDVKIFNAIWAPESNQIESIFYPYRPTETSCPEDSAWYFTMIQSSFRKQ